MTNLEDARQCQHQPARCANEEDRSDVEAEGDTGIA